MTSRTVSLEFHGVPGSQAGMARVGRHALVADRPDGVAGGQGLGFNGAELLSAALGGCFWNDLHYAAAAAAQGCGLSRVEVGVEITLTGAPLRVTAATIRARVEAGSPEQARACFEVACRATTIANSLLGAVPVTFRLDD